MLTLLRFLGFIVGGTLIAYLGSVQRHMCRCRYLMQGLNKSSLDLMILTSAVSTQPTDQTQTAGVVLAKKVMLLFMEEVSCMPGVVLIKVSSM